MLVIIGYIVIVGAVFGGFAMAGGHLGSLVQPVELLMIFGAAFGAFCVANSGKVIKVTLKALPSVLKGSKYSKALYIELLSLLFDILAKVRKEGLMSIESDVENPDQSPIFSKYPRILSDHHGMEFITDYLRLMVGGNLNAFEIENLMDVEIETHHHEGEIPVSAIAKMGDALPAFGIVAAVMGVVHTMGAIGRPPAELGSLIAAALVGTFLGILLSYGLVAPLGSLLHRRHQEVVKALQCVKVTLLASMNGYAPAIAVEFGRKVISATERPTFAELEGHVRQLKSR